MGENMRDIFLLYFIFLTRYFNMLFIHYLYYLLILILRKLRFCHSFFLQIFNQNLTIYLINLLIQLSSFYQTLKYS